MKRIIFLISILFWGSFLNADQRKEGLYVILETSMGRIVCKFYEKEAPKTVANFVELAQGDKEWVDPKTGEKVKKRFFNGLIFHRVIPDFMIQGGCPLGNGTGGPGYRFEDEISPDLHFDRAGILAMANSGPNTNGSQFFITTVPTPWLDGKHTIFGRVVKGQEVVDAISKVEKGFQDKPIKPIKIQWVMIHEEK